MPSADLKVGDRVTITGTVKALNTSYNWFTFQPDDGFSVCHIDIGTGKPEKLKPWDCLDEKERAEAKQLQAEIQTVLTTLSEEDAAELALEIYLRGWHQ